MKTRIFDGRAFAAEKAGQLQKSVFRLKKNGITPKLVTILVGDNKAGSIYVNKKKKAAESIGCNLQVAKFPKKTSMIRIIRLIRDMNLEKGVHGIMVQLPLPENFSKEDRGEIINSIAKEKDVDGMREDSNFTAPVVLAIDEVISQSEEYLQVKYYPILIALAGSDGFVGRKFMLQSVFNRMNSFKILGVDQGSSNFSDILKKADVIVSATGVTSLINKHVVKEGCALIDVGEPKGDIDISAYEKASFVSPVPGGIGPVTIVSLLENLIESCR